MTKTSLKFLIHSLFNI